MWSVGPYNGLSNKRLEPTRRKRIAMRHSSSAPRGSGASRQPSTRTGEMQSLHVSMPSFILPLFLAVGQSAAAQAPVASPADVRTIGAIVHASYETISGPAGVPRQWQRASTLYTPTATIVGVREAGGTVRTHTLTIDQYVRRLNDSAFVANGGFESEVGRHIERFGNVAEVRSVSVVRRTLDGPIEKRSVNYLQLYWDGNRWWIAGIVFDSERANAPIPEAWVGPLDDEGQ